MQNFHLGEERRLSQLYSPLDELEKMGAERELEIEALRMELDKSYGHAAKLEGRTSDLERLASVQEAEIGAWRSKLAAEQAHRKHEHEAAVVQLRAEHQQQLGQLHALTVNASSGEKAAHQKLEAAHKEVEALRSQVDSSDGCAKELEQRLSVLTSESAVWRTALEDVCSAVGVDVGWDGMVEQQKNVKATEGTKRGKKGKHEAGLSSTRLQSAATDIAACDRLVSTVLPAIGELKRRCSEAAEEMLQLDGKVKAVSAAAEAKSTAELDTLRDEHQQAQETQAATALAHVEWVQWHVGASGMRPDSVEWAGMCDTMAL